MEDFRQEIEAAPGAKRVWLCVAVFAAAFVAAATLLHLGIRRPLRLHADFRGEKLAILDAWRGRAVSASFGSSHMQDGFDPRAFDAALADSGLRTRSINLGIAGGSQTEQRAMALEFLREWKRPQGEMPPACFTLLELTAGANFADDQMVNTRTINLYDWKTVAFLRGLAPASLGWKRRVGRVGFGLAAAAMHYSNVAMWSSRLFPVPLNAERLERETVGDRRGLNVQPEDAATDERLAKEFSAAQRTERPEAKALLPGNRKLLDELAAANPVKGMRFVYVVMPLMDDLEAFPVYPESMEGPYGPVPIVSMARPDRYPELYQAKYWHDEAHLNEAGAAVGTRILAEQMKAWYGRAAAGSESSRCGE